MGLSKGADTGAPDESEHEPREDAAAAALDTLYARADELGLHYEPGFADDALAARVCDGQCDGLGTVIGRIPGRDGESGYYTCAGCKACDELWCEQCGADLSGEDNPEQHQCPRGRCWACVDGVRTVYGPLGTTSNVPCTHCNGSGLEAGQ